MKDQEKLFFQYSIYRFRYGSYFNDTPFGTGTTAMREVVNEARLIFGIQVRHLWFWLEKWTTLGFYNYKTILDLGWFEIDKFSGEYLELYNEAVERLSEKPREYNL